VERADAQLGSGQVLEDRHRAPDRRRRGAHALGVLGVCGTVAVREVQPGDVETGLHHLRQDVRITRCRTDGGDDLGTAHEPQRYCTRGERLVNTA